jgi:hypothetical protein
VLLLLLPLLLLMFQKIPRLSFPHTMALKN